MLVREHIIYCVPTLACTACSDDPLEQIVKASDAYLAKYHNEGGAEAK